MYIVYGPCLRQCYAHRIWSMVCLLMVWCQTAFNHNLCCVCWWPGAKVHVTVGKHRVCSVLCLLMTWCQTTFNHWQTQHRLCTCLLNFCHECDVWSMHSPVLRIQGMISAVSADGLLSKCIQPFTDSMNIVSYAAFCYEHSIWSVFSSVLYAWGMNNAVSADHLVTTCIQSLADAA